MPTPSRRTSIRKAKSEAKIKISAQNVMEGLNDAVAYYNMNPDTYDDNNGREGRGVGRKLSFLSSDNIMRNASPPGATVKSTATLVAPTVSSRAEQGKENDSPPAGNVGHETVVSLGDELRFNLDVGYDSPVGLGGVRAGLLTPNNESHGSWMRQMDEVVRQELPREYVERNILRDNILQDILRDEQAFWKSKMFRVLEDVDVEYFAPDWEEVWASR